MKDKFRWCALVSGGGSTMDKLNSACKNGLANAELVAVIASKADIGAIVKARIAGLEEKHLLVIDPSLCETEEQFGEKILRACISRHVDAIAQLGWLPKTPKNVIKRYAGKMWNQHPGPLDPGHKRDFGGEGMFGRRVHHARLAYCRTIGADYWTEATAQKVDAEFDRGAILNSKRLLIRADHDTSSLQEELLPIEHAVQMGTLVDFVNNRVTEKPRTERLVKKEHRFALEMAKTTACMMWPKG